MATGTGVAARECGYASIRVDDLRLYSADLPEGESLRDRIVAAAAHRYAVNHRAQTTVRVEHDDTGDTPYAAAHYNVATTRANFDRTQVHDRVRAASDRTYLRIYKIEGDWSFRSGK